MIEADKHLQIYKILSLEALELFPKVKIPYFWKIWHLGALPSKSKRQASTWALLCVEPRCSSDAQKSSS